MPLTPSTSAYRELANPDQDQQGAVLLDRLERAIEVLASSWMETYEVWPKYTTDLGLEALLACFDATGDDCYLGHVKRVWAYRHPPDESLTAGNTYFTSLHYETYLRTGEERYVRGMVGLADDWINNAPRNQRGAIGHRHPPHGALFLDLLGGLAPLLARAGRLSGNPVFYEECVRQIQLYREALFDPYTGLWHHACDWHGPGSRSPLGWGRGSGWVLRGLEKALLALPMDHPGRGVVFGSFIDSLRGLLARQNLDGTWHQLVHRPESLPEASGTGFILAALASPVLQEVSSSGLAFNLRLVLSRGIAGLLALLNDDGSIDNGCPECPPLRTESEYLGIVLRKGDPHAQAAALLAFAGARAVWKQGEVDRGHG